MWIYSTFYGLPTTIAWEAELQVQPMPSHGKETMAICESPVVGKRMIKVILCKILPYMQH